MAHDPRSPDADSCRAPAIPTLVGCIHCGQEYDSFLIAWRVKKCSAGQLHGFRCCPIPGCDGKGFDIFPLDPTYQDENGGWIADDDAEGEQTDEDDPIPF
jgi:hypothetical protein